MRSHDSNRDSTTDSDASSGTQAARANAHTDALLGIAERLMGLEKDAAVLRADIVNLAGSIREAAATPSVPKRAYTIDEVGEAIGVKASTVYKMLGPDELLSFKRDGTRRVLITDLDRYLEALRDRTQQEESGRS